MFLGHPFSHLYLFPGELNKSCSSPAVYRTVRSKELLLIQSDIKLRVDRKVLYLSKANIGSGLFERKEALRNLSGELLFAVEVQDLLDVPLAEVKLRAPEPLYFIDYILSEFSQRPGIPLLWVLQKLLKDHQVKPVPVIRIDDIVFRQSFYKLRHLGPAGVCLFPDFKGVFPSVKVGEKKKGIVR